VTIYPYILRLEGATVGPTGLSQDDIGIYKSDVRFQAPPVGLRVPHDDGEVIVIGLDVGAVPDRITGALIVRPAD
jgi:hypothetical protein